MAQRSRSFDNRVTESGTLTDLRFGPAVITTRSKTVGQRGTCADEDAGDHVSPYALDIVKRNTQFPSLVGTQLGFNQMPIRIFNNFPQGYQVEAPDPNAGVPAPTILEQSNLAWKVLSKANPSTPDISVPTFIGELKDFPSLVKNWYGLFMHKAPRFRGAAPAHWKTLLQRVPEIIASGHLTWRWAIRPFIDDVSSLLDASFLIKKRLAMLGRLSTDRKLRCRVSLGTVSATANTRVPLHSEGCNIYGQQIDTTTVRMWGTVNYHLPPGQNFPKFSEEAYSLARRLVYGITAYETLATAWELMPWSWFVDWFTGLGTVLQACNNTLGLTPSGICVMRHAKSERVLQVDYSTVPDWVTLVGSEGYCTYERKSRYTTGPLLPFAPTYLPLFEKKTLSILASLSVLKARPGRTLGNLIYR